MRRISRVLQPPSARCHFGDVEKTHVNSSIDWRHRKVLSLLLAWFLALLPLFFHLSLHINKYKYHILNFGKCKNQLFNILFSKSWLCLRQKREKYYILLFIIIEICVCETAGALLGWSTLGVVVGARSSLICCFYSANWFWWDAELLWRISLIRAFMKRAAANLFTQKFTTVFLMIFLTISNILLSKNANINLLTKIINFHFHTV